MRPGDHREDAADYYVASVLGPETYDRIHAQVYSKALEFYVGCARKYGGPLVEIGCGTGLVTWAIARDGHEITGLDLSGRMLEIASAKRDSVPSSIGERIDFIEADMADFQLGRTFKTAFIPGRSFQHLMTPDDQRSALVCIHNHLDSGGTLVMNQFDPKLEYCMPNAEPPVRHNEVADPESGQKIRRTFRSRVTDPLTQTLTEHMILEVLDATGDAISREETRWSLRWTYQQEMRYLFELTGFSVEQQYSDFDYGMPEYAKEQIWVCRKN